MEAVGVLKEVSPDSAASRLYYAVFYAVSALFKLEGKDFRKHSGLESAVHKDLVHTGRWEPSLGKAYTAIYELRYTGDYGGDSHVSTASLETALLAAKDILNAVQKLHPDLFI